MRFYGITRCCGAGSTSKIAQDPTRIVSAYTGRVTVLGEALEKALPRLDEARATVSRPKDDLPDKHPGVLAVPP